MKKIRTVIMTGGVRKGLTGKGQEGHFCSTSPESLGLCISQTRLLHLRFMYFIVYKFYMEKKEPYTNIKL